VDFINIILKRFNKTYDKIYLYSKHHFNTRFGINQDLYMEAINRNIEYINKIIDDDSTNFRNKLKRGDLIEKWENLPALQNF